MAQFPRRFLAVAANKQALIKFLGESIVQHYRLSSLEMSSGEVLYVSGVSNDPIIAKKICRDGVSDCQELYCTHEEADTRMILHAIHADKTFGESGIRPSMKLSHFRTYNVSCRIGPCIRNT
jgi:hypothetical protein